MKQIQWRCKNCGAELGMISLNGDGVPQLMVYRHAVNMQDDSPASVDVLGPLMGRMPVKCDACDDVTVWGPSPSTLLYLFDELNLTQSRQFLEAFINRNLQRFNLTK